MENDTCGRQVFHNCARKLRLVDSGCRSDTAVFTGSVAVTRPFVSDVTLTCTCRAGWKGTQDCASSTGCDRAPCSEHASCTTQGGSHSCSCVDG